jgi:uncharacterized protein
MSWNIRTYEELSCSKSILIEGLPGIGNVGKVVVDYLIDSFKAKKIASFHSYDLPNSVFVTPDGVCLPAIELFHTSINNQDFLFLSGDAQPSLERASYELTKEILELISSFSCKKIIALGGIGLSEIPQKPLTYAVGNDKELIKDFISHGVQDEAFGLVGPIVGVSGLLLGLSSQYTIPSVALLSETFGHPMYVGFSEARNVLSVLDKEFSLAVDFTDLDEEISMQNDECLNPEPSSPLAVSKRSKKFSPSELNYIG